MNGWLRSSLCLIKNKRANTAKGKSVHALTPYLAFSTEPLFAGVFNGTGLKEIKKVALLRATIMGINLYHFTTKQNLTV